MMLWSSISGLDCLTGLFSTLPFIMTKEYPLWCYPGVNQAREQQAPAVLVRISEQHSNHRIRKVDETRPCGPSLPIEPITNSLWVGADLRAQKNPLCLVGFEPGVSQL